MVIKKIKTIRKIYFLCMEEHDVDIVEMMDNEINKNKEVTSPAIYEYCFNTDEFLENEEMIKNNSMSMKDSYLKIII